MILFQQGIAATKIGDGIVSTTEFQYLNTVSSNIQTQLDAKGNYYNWDKTTIVSSDLTASRTLASNSSE